jgi:hypothetical protein
MFFASHIHPDCNVKVFPLLVFLSSFCRVARVSRRLLAP